MLNIVTFWLYDYQNTIKEQTEEIASLQKQLTAYEGDTSEETKATIQKLKVELEEAQADLEETEYEHYISEQKELLNNLYDEYELILNERLDDVDALLSDMIDMINQNAVTISETLTSEAESVGYQMTENMAAIWDVETLLEQALTSSTSTSVSTATETLSGTISDSISDLSDTTYSVVSMYGDSFSSILTTVNSVLDSISASVLDMVDSSDDIATTLVEVSESILETAVSDAETATATATSTGATNSNSSSSTSSTSSSTKSSSSSSSSSSTKSSSSSSSSSSTQGDGTPQVGDMVTFKSGKYYYDSYGSTPTGTKYLGKSVYITKINSKSGATKPYHISTGSTLGNGDLGWLTLSQLTGYETGGLVDYTGLAQLDGTPNKPEYVLSASDTENFMELTDAMSDIASGNISIADLFNNSNVSEILSNLTDTAVPDITANNASIGSVSYEINIPIENVSDYNDFVNQMVKDDKFEKFIQSMTIDRLAGGSKLAKNKYQW